MRVALHSLANQGWVPHCGFPGEGPFVCVTANVTAWGSALKWLDEDRDVGDLVCIQEHHLVDKQELESAKANALRLGYQSCLAAAHATGNADGTTGGVGFLWPLQNKISNPGAIVSCHWAMSIQIEHANLGQIVFVTFYGHQDTTITMRRLEDLIVKLEATGFCFIIAGDFNISSDDMSQWLPTHHPHMQLRRRGLMFPGQQCVHH